MIAVIKNTNYAPRPRSPVNSPKNATALKTITRCKHEIALSTSRRLVAHNIASV